MHPKSMKVAYFSSFTYSYLDRARVLAQSLKHWMPGATFIAAILDEPPPGFAFDPARDCFDRVIHPHQLPIPNLRQWLFGHNVIEACTAIKGPVLRQLLAEGYDAVIYLDPDIAVFSSLEPLHELLQRDSIVLTPHQTAAEKGGPGIQDNEIGSLKWGVFNLGFVGVKNDENGRAFASWWSDRLLHYCHDDLANGLFVDQKWCNLVPCYFDGVRILRDTGYNVASWNLSTRPVQIHQDGSITAGGSMLRFFHFTKAGPVGDLMTQRYGGKHSDVYELWAWYKRQLGLNKVAGLPNGYWKYSRFEDGSFIAQDLRVSYRKLSARGSVGGDPFAANVSSVLNVK